LRNGQPTFAPGITFWVSGAPNSSSGTMLPEPVVPKRLSRSAVGWQSVVTMSETSALWAARPLATASNALSSP
jgi:hypothetical protein